MKILSFLGVQGAGKDTQADLLVDKHGFYKITTGGLLRKEAKTNKDLRNKLARGELISDEFVLDLLKNEFLSIVSKGVDKVVITGFPRTLNQVKLFDELLKDLNLQLHAVFLFELPKDEAIKRLSLRRICPKCGRSYHLIYNPPKDDLRCDIDGTKLVQREDDKPEAIERRINKYYSTIQAIIDIYNKAGILKKIDANRPISAIFPELESLL